MLLNKDAAVSGMNKYGNQSKPFLFVVDFACSQTWVAESQESYLNGRLYNFNGIANYPVLPNSSERIKLNPGRYYQNTCRFREFSLQMPLVGKRKLLTVNIFYFLNLFV